MKTASSAAQGVGAAAMARSMRESSLLATHCMTASKIASLFGKCLNSAPCVTPMWRAMVVVVMSLGLPVADSCTTASTVAARRSSALRYLAGVCMGKDSNLLLYFPINRMDVLYLIRSCLR